MTSDRAPTNRTFSLATALWLAVLSALVGFGAVYLIGRTPDNAGDATQAGPPTGGTLPTAQAPAATGSGSEMAAFVRKTSPQPLPAFTFQDADGKPLTIADFKGKVVLLNLWATWCAPCRLEMPALDRLQAAIGSDKFEVVALSLDKDGVDKARKFFADTKIANLKFYIDPTGTEGFNLKPVGLPTTFLVDAEGREIGRLAGPAEWDSEAAKALIAEALR
jgi:thiol-disulfide isomerase/thioredoxin